MKRSLILIAVCLGVIIAAWLAFFNARGNSAKEGDRERIAVIKRGDLTLRVIETGSVEPETVVEIKSEQSGEVKKLFVKDGDHVKRDQRLAVIQQESSQARQAAQYRADLEQQRLALEDAERTLKRNRSLQAKGFLSDQEVETSEQNVKNAKIRYALARRQLQLVLGGDEQTLEHYLSRPVTSDHLEEFTVASPIEGSVIAINVEQGEIISSGTSTVTGGTVLMTLADLSHMVVKSKINEVDITQLHRGQKVEIRLDAIPGRVYHGTVGLIAPQGVRTDNIVTYEVTIPIADADARLKPSMTANIDILTGAIHQALYLPLEAVVHQHGRDYVWVRRGTETVKEPITVIHRTDTEAVIGENAGPASTGSATPVALHAGDQVVIPKPVQVNS